MDQDRKIIVHVDMDAFFAAVEQRDNPSFRGKPLIVGSLPGERGVVSTASYEARAFGVHSALPISEAYKRCPDGIYLRPRMEQYKKVSDQLMEIFSSFTPLVEPLSIDEAFLDMSGCRRLWGEVDEMAGEIARRVKSELDLTASIGVGPNKLVAKIASDLKKPAGITVAPFDEADLIEWLAPFPVRTLWGIGPKGAENLLQKGVNSVADIQRIPLKEMVDTFGRWGERLYSYARGIDSRPVAPPGKQKSIGREVTFQKDCNSLKEIKPILFSLTEEVLSRMRSSGLTARRASLIYRGVDFKRHSCAISFPGALPSTAELFSALMRKLEERWLEISPLRLVGLSVGEFSELEQLSLFDSPPESRGETIDHLQDQLQKRFGSGVIQRGAGIPSKNRPSKR